MSKLAIILDGTVQEKAWDQLIDPDSFLLYIKEDVYKGRTFTPKEIETIKVRYEEMKRLLFIMIELKFIITKLSFVCTSNFCGTVLTYRTLSGRYQTLRYVRAAASLDIIPDDFLHDLKHIPNRT